MVVMAVMVVVAVVVYLTAAATGSVMEVGRRESRPPQYE